MEMTRAAKAEMLSMSMSEMDDPMDPREASRMFCASVASSSTMVVSSGSLSSDKVSLSPMNCATRAYW